MPTRSGDIRDQSRKLSEVAPKFGGFFGPPKFYGGRPSKIMTPAWRHVVWKMFCVDTLTGPEVIGVRTLNFKQNFKFSRLKNFGETPVPVGVCASKALVNL